MIIIGTDKTELDTVTGSFGIQGGQDISIVYEGVNVVCGGTSKSGDSCGIMDEANVADGLSLSGGGTLIALGRQAGDSSCGIQLMDDVDTGSLKVSSGKVIALGGDASGSKEASCGLNASKKIQIEGGNVTAVGGAAAGDGSLSSGAAAGAGISVSSGQLVAVGGYASGTGSDSAGTYSYGTTTFSGSANVVAAGDGYGIATYLDGITPADFQLGTAASDTVTLTAMGGDGAANDKGTTTVSDKFVRCDGGVRTTAGSAVRFRLGDPIITVTHDGTVSGYGDFADGWNAAVGLDTSTNPAAVKIFADWTAEHDNDHSSSFGSGVGFYDGTTENSEGAVCVPVGKHITLDLNGFTIDRNLNEPCSDYGGWVIANLGTLSICDSGTGGTITGGYTGRNLSDSKNGGGIYNAGTLTLSGGTITKNADGEKGGGVYNAENASFTMTGGKISANLAATGEGGYTCGGGVYNDGTFTMTGGEISGNYSCDTANEDGGGVYNAGTFTVGGTAKITGNVAKAVYDYRTNSASGGVTDNVYLPIGKTIACSTETSLTGGASIGVTTADTPVSGTTVNITDSNSADYSGYFHSDKSYRVQNSGSGSSQVVQLAVMPSAGFTATSENGGTLNNVTTNMQYSIDGGANWIDVTGTTIDIADVTAANGVQVYAKGEAGITADSDAQTITVTQAVKPAGLTKTDCTTAANNDGKISGVNNTMEYRVSGSTDAWTAVTGATITGLSNQSYDVRIKASGTVLASEAQSISISAYVAPPAPTAADYTDVDKAISEIPADLSVYTNASVNVLNDAVAAVDRNKTQAEQATVNGYATAIRDAIKALKYKDADYSKVDTAIGKIPADLSGYTDASVKALNDAKKAVVRGKNITEQATVDGYATAIQKAIDGLVKKTGTTGNNNNNNNNDSNKDKNVTSPQTGDSSNMFLWLAILMISAGGIVTIGITQKTRKKHSER
jgi:hypothetical protein